MLAQVAKLCALRQMPEAVAVQAFRAAYHAANEAIATRSAADFDAFSAAQVLTEWHQNIEFIDKEGLPRRISAIDQSFDRLCASAVARATHLAAEFVSTLTHNLTRPVSEPSRFERTVVSSKLSPRSVPALLAYLSLHGQAFLEDLDSWMSSRESSETASEVGVGVYLYVRKD